MQTSPGITRQGEKAIQFAIQRRLVLEQAGLNLKSTICGAIIGAVVAGTFSLLAVLLGYWLGKH